jgi:5-formyltetrahydrofolate cyclo-ligase
MVTRDKINMFIKMKYDEQITEFIVNSDEYKNCKNVLVYVSVGSEFDTEYLREQAVKDKKTVAYPKVYRENSDMNFFIANNTNNFISGAYGIKEPLESTPLLIKFDKTLCIVPGIVFDKNGNRIGYGGGYYDKFIAEHPEIKTIGATYSCMLVDDIPIEEHDKKVEVVVTENGYERTSNS